MNNYKLKTAVGCENVTENAGKMFFPTSDVPPTNINKNCLDIFDDSMLCDDEKWAVSDVDGNKESNISEIKNKSSYENIPPKSDTSTCASPKSKKRKLSSYDELINNIIQNLDYIVLYTNLRKLLSFLESNYEECPFPFTSKEYESFFEMIVQDVDILKSKRLDADYGYISDQIIKAAAGNSLFYVFEDRREYEKRIMVIKKLPKMDQSENSAPAASSTTATKIPPSNLDPNSQSRSAPIISNGFKIHCLCALIAFIKNKAIKIKEFPELNADQAKFIQLLGKVSVSEFGGNSEVNELYRKLVQTIQVYGMQFELRILSVHSWGGKKTVVFEKVPNPLLSQTTENSNIMAVDSGQTMNPNTNSSKLQALNIPVTPNTDTSKPDAPKMFTFKAQTPTGEIPKTNAPKSQGSKPDVPKSQGAKIDAPKSKGPKIDLPKTVAPESQGPKTDVPKSQGQKVDATYPQDPKIDAPNSQGPKTDATKSQGPKIDVLKTIAPESQGPKTDVPKSQGPKIEVPKTTAPESQGPKTYAQASKTEVLKPVPDTKQNEMSIMDRLKLGMEKVLIRNTSRNFISATLNKILHFLSNSKEKKLVFVPNNQTELEFYRKCIDWCRSDTQNSIFGEEFRDIHCRISRLMSECNIEATKKTDNPLNKLTAIREVSYVKSIKDIPNGESLSAPRKQKVNLKKALQLAATDDIKLESVINLNQSLRSKKKDKKLKKAEKANKRASKEASVKQEKQTNGSNSHGNSMDSDRDKARDKSQSAAKRPSSEMSQSTKPASNRPTRYGFNKEKLIEAMSVPVQSDIARRMMLGMGWSGGALGARGDGITEPIMPALEIDQRAGFGLASHKAQKQASKQSNQTSNPVKVPKTSPASKSDGDARVDKTKELPGNSTSDTNVKTTERKTIHELPDPSTSKFQFTSAWTSHFELLKPTTSKVELSKPATSKVELPKPTTSKLELSKLTTTKIELSKPIIPKVELSKPIIPKVELPKPKTSKVRPSISPPTQTRYNIELQKPGNVAPTIRLPFRQEILQSVWELLNSDHTCKTLKYDRKLNKAQKRFIDLGLRGLKARNLCYTFAPSELPLCTQIREKYAEFPDIFIDARYFFDYKSLDLMKLPAEGYAEPLLPEKIKPNFDIKLTEENLHSYILSTNGACDSAKQFETLKFKVLFLFNVLNFVKSLNEEVEITFNRVLDKRQFTYMENVIDEVNMRIKFGSTRAESLLGDQIRENVKDAFLGLMCNHQFLKATISKYYRFKRLNRPDNAVKRIGQTACNLDDFTSDAIIDAKINTVELKREPRSDAKVKYDINDGVDVTYVMPLHKYEFYEDTNVSYDKTSAASHKLEPCDSDTSSDAKFNTGELKREPIYDKCSDAKVKCNFSVDVDVNFDMPQHKYEFYRGTSTNVSNDETSAALQIIPELEHCDSDDSSIEEYININANNKVPKLQPGEEGVNISNFLYLYDKEKTNTVGTENNSLTINNNSASNVTDMNNKNNFGNGNVDIDYNDNQFIDMKRQGGDTNNNNEKNDILDWETADYDNLTFDYNEEEVFINPVTSIQNKDDFDNQDVILVEDSNSHSDCSKDTVKIYEIENPPLDDSKESSDDVIMEDVENEIIDISEDSMVGIGIAEDELKPLIKQEEPTVVIDKQESMAEFKYGEPIPVVIGNRYESAAVMDKSLAPTVHDEALSVIKPDKSLALINQEKLIAVIEPSEIKEEIDKDDSMAVTNHDKSKVVINTDDPAKLINQVESSKEVIVTQIKKETSISPSDVQIAEDDLEIKTDCDKIKKENLDLSEKDICDTHPVESSHEKTGNDLLNDKISDIRHVRIEHTHHPLIKLTLEKVKKIQRHITNSIGNDVLIRVPLLKCHGPQNGVLFYTCLNKNSYDWLQKTIRDSSYAKVCDNNVKPSKMVLKMFCLFEFDSLYLFRMLEVCNRGISTKDWVVENTEKNGDYIFFIVIMDEFSIQFIQKSNFELCAGVDKAEFNFIWE